MTMTLADRKPVGVLQTSAQETRGDLSPDGQFVAYESNESGRSEVTLAANSLSRLHLRRFCGWPAIPLQPSSQSTAPDPVTLVVNWPALVHQ